MMIDAASQSIEMTSTNLSLSEYLLVKEYITYTPTTTPQSAHATKFRQVADIVSSSQTFGSSGLMAKAGKKLEDQSFDRFGSNAQKGREGLMTVLANLWGASGAGKL